MGKLIVFEGTDGTGKSTQFALLTKRLQNENVSFRRLQFPQYLEPSSALIRMYLNGEVGENPNDVNAYAASTFYAVDRFASYQRVWKNDYASGGLILSDRYTTSNAVHQGGKLEGKAREEFFSWLYDLEFNRMGLPKPDLVLWLDRSPRRSCADARATPAQRPISTSATTGTCTNAARSRSRRRIISAGRAFRASGTESSAPSRISTRNCMHV